MKKVILFISLVIFNHSLSLATYFFIEYNILIFTFRAGREDKERDDQEISSSGAIISKKKIKTKELFRYGKLTQGKDAEIGVENSYKKQAFKFFSVKGIGLIYLEVNTKVKVPVKRINSTSLKIYI